MKQSIGGYNYYPKKAEAQRTLKNKNEVVAYEAGLGWYKYNKVEYANNPRKRIFGF